MKRNSLIVFILCFALFAAAQVQILPQVVNSAGGSVNVSGIQIDYNIGEPCVSTINSGALMLTQGFLQPERLGLSAVAFPTDVSCSDQTDGSIIVTASVTGAPAGTTFSYEYHWWPPFVCSQSSTCHTVSDLPPGTYSVTVIAVYAGGPAASNDTTTISNIVINGSTAPCILEVFNGVTPNGDGYNDFFFIKNIDLFPNNVVYIYNRWGLKLDEVNNYDNKTNLWKGTVKGGSSDIAPSGTYYYIIDLKNGSPLIKGWLELTHR